MNMGGGILSQPVAVFAAFLALAGGLAEPVAALFYTVLAGAALILASRPDYIREFLGQFDAGGKEVSGCCGYSPESGGAKDVVGAPEMTCAVE